MATKTVECKDLKCTLPTLKELNEAVTEGTKDITLSLDKEIDIIQKELDGYGLTHEQKSLAVIELMKVKMQLADTRREFMLDFELNRTVKEKELAMKTLELQASIAGTERKTKGYDDELMVQAMTAAGKLANYALNIDNVNACARVNDFKQAVNTMVKRIDGGTDIFKLVKECKDETI